MQSLFPILYSVAGAKSQQAFEALESVNPKILEKRELECLELMIESYKSGGEFPSITLLTARFGNHGRTCKNVPDLKISLSELVEERSRTTVISDINDIIANASSTDEIKDQLMSVLSLNAFVQKNQIKLPGSMSEQYLNRKNNNKSIITGVKELDELTNGWQAGLMHALCGFTGSGKTSFAVNSAYLNVVKGKKVAILSLEIPRDYMYLTYYSRHSYALGSEMIPYSDIYNGKITEEQENYLFNVVEPDFKALPGELLILEQNDFINYSFNGIVATLREAERVMGGLDYFILDHANLLQYISTDGKKPNADEMIKIFSDVARTYKTADDSYISVGLVVQTNREGYKRAVKNKGNYDLLAISEFREIERSCSYISFLFTDPSMLRANEMKVKLAKNRVGRVQEEPVVTYYYPPCSVIGETFSEAMDGDVDALIGDYFSTAGGLSDFGEF